MPADGIVMAKEAFRLVEQLQAYQGEEVLSYLVPRLRHEPPVRRGRVQLRQGPGRARHQARPSSSATSTSRSPSPEPPSHRGGYVRPVVDDGARGAQAWAAFVEGLRTAGERLAAETAGLGPEEQADGYRALLRGLGNQLGRFEVDRERPELVPFNGWRQKMFMDNPDFRYWVADVRDDRRYRITGAIGDAVYLSITAYASGGTLDAVATARVDSDALAIDAEGALRPDRRPRGPADGSDWLALPEGATAAVGAPVPPRCRQRRLGWCDIEPLDAVDVPPIIDPDRFERHLRRLGRRHRRASARSWTASTADDLERPNEARHWSEMAGGAAFTEPNIHYLRARGGWTTTRRW